MADLIEQHIFDQLTENGRMRTKDIIAAMPDEARKIKTRLSDMTKEGRIESPKRGIYVLPFTSAQTRPDEASQQISEQLRSAEDNKVTISKLLNAYDGVLDAYIDWLAESFGGGRDFEKRPEFVETLKLLTMIGDKLMKRWSLEHVGYDTNARQAQEDAKAKTAEREKAALEDAPLEETVQIVGHYHTDLKELWDAMPPSEKEKRKV